MCLCVADKGSGGFVRNNNGILYSFQMASERKKMREKGKQRCWTRKKKNSKMVKSALCVLRGWVGEARERSREKFEPFSENSSLFMMFCLYLIIFSQQRAPSSRILSLPPSGIVLAPAQWFLLPPTDASKEKGEKRRRNKSFVYGKKINDCFRTHTRVERALAWLLACLLLLQHPRTQSLRFREHKSFL